MSLTLGYNAEKQACTFLKAQGLRLIKSNFKSKMGEIDLIMQDKDALVFVEVKARSENNFGGALSSVTLSKRQKLIKTASLYLMKQPLHDKQFIRFDVVGIEGNPPKINWIKNAFGINF